MKAKLIVGICAVMALAMCVSVIPTPKASAYILPSWGYSRAITVTNPLNNGIFTGGPVRVFLNDTNFGWSHAQADLDDLRFVDAAHTQYEYWIEHLDYTNKMATVIVNLTAMMLPAGTYTIYANYGNAGAAGISDMTTCYYAIDEFEGYPNLNCTTNKPVQGSTSTNGVLYEKYAGGSYFTTNSSLWREGNDEFFGIQVLNNDSYLTGDKFLFYGSMVNATSSVICGATEASDRVWTRSTTVLANHTTTGGANLYNYYGRVLDPYVMKDGWNDSLATGVSNRHWMYYATSGKAAANNYTNISSAYRAWPVMGAYTRTVYKINATECKYHVDGVRAPVVWKEASGNYHMLYSGKNDNVDSGAWKIFLANSTDGLNWTGHGQCIDIGDWGWDSASIEPQDVHIVDGLITLLYSGENGAGVTRLGMATAATGDLQTWSKKICVTPLGDSGDFDDTNIYDGSMGVNWRGTDTFRVYSIGTNSTGTMALSDLTAKNTTWFANGTYRMSVCIEDDMLKMDQNESRLLDPSDGWGETWDNTNKTKLVEAWFSIGAGNISMAQRDSGQAWTGRDSYRTFFNNSGHTLNLLETLNGNVGANKNFSAMDDYNGQYMLGVKGSAISDIWGFGESFETNDTGNLYTMDDTYTGGVFGLESTSVTMTTWDWYRQAPNYAEDLTTDVSGTEVSATVVNDPGGHGGGGGGAPVPPSQTDDTPEEEDEGTGCSFAIGNPMGALYMVAMWSPVPAAVILWRLRRRRK